MDVDPDTMDVMASNLRAASLLIDGVDAKLRGFRLPIRKYQEKTATQLRETASHLERQARLERTSWPCDQYGRRIP